MSLRRREFVGALGGAAVWPLAARAQQRAMPVIGYLTGTVPRQSGGREDVAFRQGLREVGFVEGQNAIIEYRSALGRYERLPEMATDLVRRQVAVIFATGSVPAPLAARSFLEWAPTRSNLVWSPASAVRAATSPASPAWAGNCSRSGSNCCVSFCPMPPRSASWSTRAIRTRSPACRRR